MLLAGIPVRDDLVVELAEILTYDGSVDTAAKILHAHAEGRDLVALSIDDRKRILEVLLDCPEGLAELRGTLFAEHTARKRAGLA